MRMENNVKSKCTLTDALLIKMLMMMVHYNTLEWIWVSDKILKSFEQLLITMNWKSISISCRSVLCIHTESKFSSTFRIYESGNFFSLPNFPYEIKAQKFPHVAFLCVVTLSNIFKWNFFLFLRIVRFLKQWRRDEREISSNKINWIIWKFFFLLKK
jgi:hypothetical protein